MSGWFRVYSELIDDPKFIKLGPELRSALLMTWCVAAENNGHLPSLEDIAIKFRLPEARTAKLLEELKHRGLIDEDDNGSTPHNWNGRQYKSDVSTERVNRFRKRHRNVSSNGDETFHETGNISSVKRNFPESVSVSSLSSSATSLELEESQKEQACGKNGAEFVEFWREYPNKIGKMDARKKFDNALKLVSFEKLMDGLRIYKNKADDRPWCNPATWLNQGRWDDQPAQIDSHANGGGNAKTPNGLTKALAKLRESIDRDTEPGEDGGEPSSRLL